MQEVTPAITEHQANRELQRAGYKIKWHRLLRRYRVVNSRGTLLGLRQTVVEAFELARADIRENTMRGIDT